jgi:hypothetical protein
MGAPACWIGVAARAHALLGKRDGFVMFAHGTHQAVKRVAPGDWFAYYAPTETLGGKDPVRRFVTLGTIAPGEPQLTVMGADGEGWQRQAQYREAAETDVYDLLPRLSFVADRTHWGMYFRRSLFSVTPEDFTIIAQAMGVQPSFEPETHQ